VLQGSDDIASRAIELLKETFTSLGPKLRATQVYSVTIQNWQFMGIVNSLNRIDVPWKSLINITSSTQILCEYVTLCHFGTYTLII